jgi:hypothetical protein
VKAKFAKEKELFLQIHLPPHCFLYFINVLMINLIQWAVRKGKDRIFIDCTKGPDGADTNSSANTYIPGPKENDTGGCMPTCPLCKRLLAPPATPMAYPHHASCGGYTPAL